MMHGSQATMQPRLPSLLLGLGLAGMTACASHRAVAVTSPAPAGAAAADAGTAATTPERVHTLLSQIADDSLEGRRTGEPGALRAATIIARRMQESGLEAAGDSGWFQRVPVALLMVTSNRNGQQVQSERLVLMPDFHALDTIPPERRKRSVNVVGILRGSNPHLREQYVLVDAHYDHLGIGRPVNGDSIYNGADDDASGVVAVLEIAHALARGPRPARTVVFAATTGEEVGLLGTHWFIQHPAIPLDQMAANLEIEMIGRPDSLAGGPGRAWLTGYERSTMGEMLAANGIPIVPDPRPQQNFFRRSDNIAFAQMGIPAHTLSTFNLHADYHRPGDEVSKTDAAHMAAVINAAARAVRLLANGARPEWKTGMRPCQRDEQPQPGVCSR